MALQAFCLNLGTIVKHDKISMEREMDWFEKNKPYLSPFQQSTSLSVKSSSVAHIQEEEIFMLLQTKTASKLKLVS